jgi:hypothetical protein
MNIPPCPFLPRKNWRCRHDYELAEPFNGSAQPPSQSHHFGSSPMKMADNIYEGHARFS